MKAPSTQLLRALRSSLSSRPITHQSQYLPLTTQWHRSRSLAASHAPSPDRSRGPKSKETTQTDFGTMDVLGSIAPPTTAIDACLDDGFILDNGVTITDGAGMILVGGEAFAWEPWKLDRRGRAGMLNSKGQWEVSEDAWGVLDLIWPKPDMLILGLGASIYPITPATRRRINEMGIQVDIQDTRNASAQFNLLATERGVSTIAAALIPIGWKGRA